MADKIADTPDGYTTIGANQRQRIDVTHNQRTQETIAGDELGSDNKSP